MTINFHSLDYASSPRFYNDFLFCLLKLNSFWSDYKEVDSPQTFFHTYTEFKDSKQLMSAASFMATQPEQFTLIVWSDYDISLDPIFTLSNGRIINKVWCVFSEAMDSPIEGYTEILEAKDRRYWLQSDLLRLLVLYKYGGVWFDMDVVLLNTFAPFVGLEFLYSWGGDFDYNHSGACATVASIHAHSDLAIAMLSKLRETPPKPMTTCWGKELFAAVYREYQYRILPSAFFNTEWCINLKYPGFAEYVELGWFHTRPDNHRYIFPEVFSWHWHNSSKFNNKLVQGCKFMLLVDLTVQRLRQGNFDLFADYVESLFYA